MNTPWDHAFDFSTASSSGYSQECAAASHALTYVAGDTANYAERPWAVTTVFQWDGSPHTSSHDEAGMWGLEEGYNAGMKVMVKDGKIEAFFGAERSGYYDDQSHLHFVSADNRIQANAWYGLYVAYKGGPTGIESNQALTEEMMAQLPTDDYFSSFEIVLVDLATSEATILVPDGSWTANAHSNNKRVGFVPASTSKSFVGDNPGIISQV